MKYFVVIVFVKGMKTRSGPFSTPDAAERLANAAIGRVGVLNVLIETE